MDKAAIYHRPQSEMAYLVDKNIFHILIRTKHSDINRIEVIYGDLIIEDLNGHHSFSHAKINNMEILFKTQIYDYWSVKIPLKLRNNLQYIFHIFGNNEEDVLYDSIGIKPYIGNTLYNLLPFYTPYYQMKDLKYKNQEWSSQIIWYEIIVDRFSDGNKQYDPINVSDWSKNKSTNDNFFGGDLRGIINHLDYLSDLGINGIKLSPIFESFSNLKMDPIDLYNISMLFGNKQDLRELVQKAHQKGIKILIKFPIDRLSEFSFQWQDVQIFEKNSQFLNWFLIRKFPLKDLNSDQYNYVYLNDGKHTPKLNLQNLDVQKYLLDMACYWSKVFDIDGWEIPNADEIDYNFLRIFTDKMHDIKKDFLVVGQYRYFSNRALLSNCIDSSNNLSLIRVIEDFFIRKIINVTDMISRINESLSKNKLYINNIIFNNVDNIYESRIYTKCNSDLDLLRGILAFIFLQKGTPNILYGTEICLKGKSFPETMAPMNWDLDGSKYNIITFLKELIDFRKRYIDFICSGHIEWKQINNRYRYFSYIINNNRGKIFSLFNFGTSNIKVVLPKKSKILISQNFNNGTLNSNGFIILKNL